jgi:hypothetical protein
LTLVLAAGRLGLLERERDLQLVLILGRHSLAELIEFQLGGSQQFGETDFFLQQRLVLLGERGLRVDPVIGG